MAEQTMVERVARALAAELGHDRVDEAARAAIEAMREPTEAMIDSGQNAFGTHTCIIGARHSYRAMIDAALK